jgi:hypothetical protein
MDDHAAKHVARLIFNILFLNLCVAFEFICFMHILAVVMLPSLAAWCGLISTGSGAHHSKQYAKAIFKYVTARGLRGKWGGNRKRHAPTSTSSLGAKILTWSIPRSEWDETFRQMDTNGGLL